MKTPKKAPTAIALGIDEASGQVTLSISRPGDTTSPRGRSPQRKAAIEEFLRRHSADLVQLQSTQPARPAHRSAPPGSFVTDNGTEFLCSDALSLLGKLNG
jgi:hypothetical protein